MKPKRRTNYIRFPKKLRRMRKYISKSKRTDNILNNYRNNYFLIYFQLWFYEKSYDAIKKGMLSNMLPM